MKLFNFYDTTGSIRLGAVAGSRVLDLTGHFPEESSFGSVARWLRAPEDVRARTRELLQGEPSSSCAWLAIQSLKHAPLVDRDCRIFCVGLNYADHAAENKIPPPESPIFFAKLASVVTPHGAPLPLTAASNQVDYEAEMAFVIGRRARQVPESDAARYIGGYTIMNDVTARDLQFHDGQWFRGKNCDGFAPLGPWLVTPDEIPNLDNLEITLRLNGQVRQQSRMHNLFFKPPKLLSFLSQTLTLEAGDVISTGTPAGIGYYAKPPVFLQPGDVVEIEISRVGILRNPVEKGNRV